MVQRSHESAVSPVVGVMLMLVVVIIIAAIVSAFAGSAVSTQKKVPQATVTGKFSVAQGFEITHAGGDPLATSDLIFTIRDNPVFGPNVEQVSAQVLNKSAITNAKYDALVLADGSTKVPAFISGDVLYVNASDTSCDIMQPSVAPSDYRSNQTGITYPSNKKPGFWRLCIRNPDNIGKTFSLEVSDKRGNVISRTDVPIAA